MDYDNAKEICQRFANEHKLIFEQEGEVGFGRDCVGFVTKRGSYLDHNPHNMQTFDPIPGTECKQCYPPHSVGHAYHKHNCLCVLLGPGVTNVEATIELALWVQHIEAQGVPKVIHYETGATGAQVLFSGLTGYCLVIEPRPAQVPVPDEIRDAPDLHRKLMPYYARMRGLSERDRKDLSSAVKFELKQVSDPGPNLLVLINGWLEPADLLAVATIIAEETGHGPKTTG